MKKIIFLPLLALSFNSWALECEPLIDQPEGIENLLNGVTEKKRDWFAASEDKVLKAPCRKEYPTLAEQENYLKKLTDGVPTSKGTINGVALEDSPAMLALFKDLTTYQDYGDAPPEDAKKLGQRYKIGADCKKVQCALTKMFGDKRAKEMLFMKQKFGLNISPITKPSMQDFTDSELGQIKKAVMDMPPHLLPLEENKQCTRLHKDYSLGLGTLANATITFANDWNKYTPGLMQATVLHEMAHNFGSEKNLDESKEWLTASGWVQKDEEWSTSKDNFVSDYAASNPHEDFAETVVAFRYDPAKLKAVSPEKYKFIKDRVFGGVEYTTAQMCLDSNLSISKALEKLKPTLASFAPTAIDSEMKKNLVSYCRKDSVEAILDRGYKPYEDCIEGAIALELAKKQLKKDNPSMSAADIEANIFTKINGRSAKEAFGVKFSDAQKTQIAEFSQNLLDDYEIAAFKKADVFQTHTTAASYCSEFVGDYAYQNFEKLQEDMKDKFTIYDQKELLGIRLTEKCLRVQKSFPKFRAFKESDFKSLTR